MHQPSLFSEPEPLFSYQRGQELKANGMAHAALPKKDLLELAQDIAVELAKTRGTISADDVQFELHRRGISIKALGNSAGSLFIGDKWQWTGDRVKSKRTHAHGNEIKTWRLRKQ